MQTGKNAVESVKEATSNIAASAKSGMDKTKATVQEKVDKMKAQDDHEKALATEKKSERLMDAELRKQQAMSHNATQKDANTAVSEAGTRIPEGAFGTGANNTTTAPQYSHSSTGATGHPTGAHQMSAMPGHGTGEPTGGHVVVGLSLGPIL
ncbi:18 kDa seed maturation protein [Bienertia sinuspersici]